MSLNTTEKYSLKWNVNDFQKTVSNSFSLLRSESDLCDVTLVSEDFIYTNAHKVVLSSSSKFFKTLLKKTSGSPNALLYLGGISSQNLKYCLDYMYNGEVEVLHDHLDELLTQAQ